MRLGGKPQPGRILLIRPSRGMLERRPSRGRRGRLSQGRKPGQPGAESRPRWATQSRPRRVGSRGGSPGGKEEDGTSAHEGSRPGGPAGALRWGRARPEPTRAQLAWPSRRTRHRPSRDREPRPAQDRSAGPASLRAYSGLEKFILA
jgi:hypothetical protein